MIKVYDDIQKLLFAKKYVILILLDSSAAFDTVDHTVLLEKLEADFFITGDALEMIKSYLSKRKFSTKVNKTTSSQRDLLYGVPQGSLLGPLLYIMYTKEVEKLVLDHNINIHMYADDCQLYTSFDENQLGTIKSKVENCLSDIKLWMDKNYLKLNTDKTLIKIFNPNSKPAINININNIPLSDSVKVLGVNVDDNLRLSSFIAKKCQICSFHIRNLRNIKDSLNRATRILLVTNLILSTLDYCNILLLPTTDKDIRPLKIVLNRAIRFICNLKFRTHISPFYQQLHILPIRFRIKFKACLMAFKVFNKISPNYITEQFEAFKTREYMKSRTGIGRDDCMFSMEKEDFRNKNLISLIKKEWYDLPFSLRKCDSLTSFKSKLKTHFYVVSSKLNR